jgi:hypothetical protein
VIGVLSRGRQLAEYSMAQNHTDDHACADQKRNVNKFPYV